MLFLQKLRLILLLLLDSTSPLYMGLNQGPVVVMIENYRTGLIWDLFMSHPDVKRGLEALDAIR